MPLLRTLGGPELEGMRFGREKPLLLLAYLAVEGPKPRRHLAELFWPRARDALNSLAVALLQLRPLGVVVGEEVLAARVDLDLPLVFQALKEGRVEEALRLYRGAFLERLTLRLPEELEEWVWRKREAVARKVAQGVKRAATGLAALGFWEEAEALWERLASLPGLLEPPRLPRLARFLLPEEDRRAFFRLLLGGEIPGGETLVRLRLRGLVDARGRPLLEPPLGLEAREEALVLARRRPLREAAYLYRLASPLLRGEDLGRAVEAFLAEAQALLSRNPKDVLRLLEGAPDLPPIRLQRARALERLGRFREALELLRGLPETEEVRLLRGIIAFRLGRREEAWRVLEGAKEGSAEAWNLRGYLLLGEGRFQEAAEAFARAAVRFLAQGEEERYAGALGNRALALAEGQVAREVVERAFQEALSGAKGALARARLLLNLGVFRERLGDVAVAESLYREALELGEEGGSLEVLGRASNNLGALYHRQGRREEAEDAYQRALLLAREAGEVVLTAAVLANLAELRGEGAFLEEAVALLAEAGHEALAERYRERMARLG
ncbi:MULTISPECIES: tetratricopeptide repeat protein [Thermus]|uniref:tetratricopeptide repeat protein n=1 Tax=Thermus brockianus TaxID=56956 RepID=UPI001F1D872D|nr:tetratricopeptide repeat protein [Thermus brockianus]